MRCARASILLRYRAATSAIPAAVHNPAQPGEQVAVDSVAFMALSVSPQVRAHIGIDCPSLARRLPR